MSLDMPTAVPNVGDAPGRRRRMRIIANVARWVAFNGIVLIVAYEGYLWFNADAMAALLKIGNSPAAVHPSHRAIFQAWLINLVPAAIFVTAMWNVGTLFSLLASERIFHPAIPRLLRRLGYLAIGGAIAGIVARTAVGLVLTFDIPVVQPVLIVGIDTEEITSLVVGLLLLAFALAMQEALLIEEDNKGFV